MNIDQPDWVEVSSFKKAKDFAKRVGYPILVRPSYVLSGAAMNIIYNEKQLSRYLNEASLVSPDHPVVISQFIESAKELEMDGVAQKGEIICVAMSEHVENAGVHSGDATIVLPPQRLYLETIRRTKKITAQIVKELNISGPFNIQFIAKDNSIRVIECNLRASRSFPFVSKVTGHNLINIATDIMLGKLKKAHYETLDLNYVGVKAPQFSYQRLKGANPVAHVEMSSTGEVACLGEDLYEAFYKAWQATDQSIERRKIFVSIGGHNKPRLFEPLKALDRMGWEIYTTAGTHDYLAQNGVASRYVHKISDERDKNVMDIILNHEVDLIINIPRSAASIEASHITDGFKIRRLAIDHHIPLITNLQIAQLMLQCLAKLHDKDVPVRSWRDYMDS